MFTVSLSVPVPPLNTELPLTSHSPPRRTPELSLIPSALPKAPVPVVALVAAGFELIPFRFK
ncbi:hypothetical protein [Legionella tunisiensis]|uniref:hypothetical protein n=1 Tax=Legionella tunisiensis TaxID=1034944 RepID=UPI0018DC4DBD|nr:hypothetical protein [Legionella tunisiensis]